MEVATKSLAELHASRDPFAMAPYGVSWAGEEKSANWFDTAREFTERWHHQQQIRLAVMDSALVDFSHTGRKLTYCPGAWILLNFRA